jgi:hypothetical protein
MNLGKVIIAFSFLVCVVATALFADSFDASVLAKIGEISAQTKYAYSSETAGSKPAVSITKYADDLSSLFSQLSGITDWSTYPLEGVHSLAWVIDESIRNSEMRSSLRDDAYRIRANIEAWIATTTADPAAPEKVVRLALRYLRFSPGAFDPEIWAHIKIRALFFENTAESIEAIDTISELISIAIEPKYDGLSDDFEARATLIQDGFDFWRTLHASIEAHFSSTREKKARYEGSLREGSIVINEAIRRSNVLAYLGLSRTDEFDGQYDWTTNITIQTRPTTPSSKGICISILKSAGAFRLVKHA